MGKTGPAGSWGIADRRRVVSGQQEVLWNEVLSLAGYVETALNTAVEALCQGRLELVDQVRAEDQEIDRWEVRIETECLRVLAATALVATDLRRVVAALRINRDLEGMADLAEYLAKRAPQSSAASRPPPFFAPAQPARLRGDRRRGR